MSKDKQIKLLQSEYENLRRKYKKKIETMQLNTIRMIEITLELLHGYGLTDQDILIYYNAKQEEMRNKCQQTIQKDTTG